LTYGRVEGFADGLAIMWSLDIMCPLGFGDGLLIMWPLM